MVYLRWLLLPVSILYGLFVWLRNRLYDWGVLRQTGFALPVIAIGNLEVGGTGKTPMTEYLIRLLSDRYRLATLSRGYGRQTKGYREIAVGATAAESGDEPLQFKQKFPKITVVVDENRVRGVARLKDFHDVILLDDAFQHRALRPGFSILLFDFTRLARPRFLLPAGDYRDNYGERRRADLIVVTKCPIGLGQQEKNRISSKLNRRGVEQPILFAHMKYGTLEPVPGSLADGKTNGKGDRAMVLLVTGIARPAPLREYIETWSHGVSHLAFPDHHRFSDKDLEMIRQRYQALTESKKMIVTTEKDAKRLADPRFAAVILDLPLYYIPIRLDFHDSDKTIFERNVLKFVAGEHLGVNID